MKVFISWSGAASRAAAELLRVYLPCMLQEIRPFVSSHDLASGTRWSAELSKELDEAAFGVICLTPDNLHSDWILFEAGALTKHVEGRACCLLLQDLGPADVSGPLAQFQNRTFERTEVAKLLADLNTLLPNPLPEPNLRMIFDKWWPEIETQMQAAYEKLPPASASPRREPNDLFEELLLRVRSIQTRIERPEVSEQAPPRDTPLEERGTLDFVPDQERHAYFTVSFERFNPGSAALLASLDPSVTFQSLLDEIYRHVSDHVPSYTYGATWILRDIETGATIKHRRMRADGSVRSSTKDNRKLTEIGIRPGAKLEAIKVSDLPTA